MKAMTNAEYGMRNVGQICVCGCEAPVLEWTDLHRVVMARCCGALYLQQGSGVLSLLQRGLVPPPCPALATLAGLYRPSHGGRIEA